MIKAAFGSELDATVEKVFPFLRRIQLHPNYFTLGGFFISLLGAFFLAAGALRWGAFIAGVGATLDLMDGVVARHQGRSSSFGAFLDSTLDRVVDIALFFAIAMYFQKVGEPAWSWIAGFALVCSVTVSYAKARAESLLPGFEGGWFERGERLLVLLTGTLLGLLKASLLLVAIGSALTVAQRIHLAWKKLSALDAEASSNAAGGSDVR